MPPSKGATSSTSPSEETAARPFLNIPRSARTDGGTEPLSAEGIRQNLVDSTIVCSLQNALDRRARQHEDEVRKRQIAEKEREVIAQKVAGLELCLKETTAQHDNQVKQLKEDLRAGLDKRLGHEKKCQSAMSENQMFRASFLKLKHRVQLLYQNEDRLKDDLRKQLSIIEDYQENNNDLHAHLSTLSEDKKTLLQRLAGNEIRMHEFEKVHSCAMSKIAADNTQLQHQIKMAELENEDVEFRARSAEERYNNAVAEYERETMAFRQNVDDHAEREQRTLRAEQDEFRVFTDKLLTSKIDAERAQAEHSHLSDEYHLLTDANQDLERRLSNCEFDHAQLAKQHAWAETVAQKVQAQVVGSAEEAVKNARVEQELEAMRAQVEREFNAVRVEEKWRAEYAGAEDDAKRMRALNEMQEDRIGSLATQLDGVSSSLETSRKREEALLTCQKHNDALVQKNESTQMELDCTLKQCHEIESKHRALQEDYISMTQARNRWERISADQAAELDNARLESSMELEQERRRLADIHSNSLKKCQEEAKTARREMADARDRLEGKALFLEEQTTRLKNQLDTAQEEYHAHSHARNSTDDITYEAELQSAQRECMLLRERLQFYSQRRSARQSDGDGKVEMMATTAPR
eukprot:GEMP01025346.1.p1 GENE.GEMP01025346.1~~GEMP01025346.1.p1  ORF type:complete len:638 (+),score=190.66 GEMP01025346.1:47-1960(+)